MQVGKGAELKPISFLPGVLSDGGYNYGRLKEKMDWLDIDPASVRQIFITRMDTDHVVALERDSELLFKEAVVEQVWRKRTRGTRTYSRISSRKKPENSAWLNKS